ncbi:MAG: pyridoxamine 5'-phosphate oxidase [Sphingomonadales bacterium]
MSISENKNPIELFSDWMARAEDGEPHEPEAAALATADANGRPSVRMVLIKDWSDEGFVFFTNLNSRKAKELAQNPHAALCFHWKSNRRQVRIEGSVEPVEDAVADAYFTTRDRGSQIGAWASRQSSPMEGRFALEREIVKFTAKFGVSRIPRPEFWSGFRIVPKMIEFWSSGEFRLHNRLVYYRDGDSWRTERLFP